MAQRHLHALGGLGGGVSQIALDRLHQGPAGDYHRGVFIVELDDVHADVLAHVRAIRVKSSRAGIICLVGNDNWAMRVAAAQAGADHCLERSTPQVLLRSVVQALMRRL